MTAHALLFTLAAIGISETAYLIRKRKASEKPVCVLGEECGLVLQSKYNSIFYLIHNDVLGFIFYIVISFITGFLVIGVAPVAFWGNIAKLIIGAGTLISLLFIYLQWRVIRAWCFWCIMSAMTIFGMQLILLLSNLIINF